MNAEMTRNSLDGRDPMPDPQPDGWICVIDGRNRRDTPAQKDESGAGSTRQPSPSRRPPTGIKNQRIVGIISICSHFLPTPCKDVWEAKLHGGLKINPKLAITVNYQTCVELSAFLLRLNVVSV